MCRKIGKALGWIALVVAIFIALDLPRGEVSLWDDNIDRVLKLKDNRTLSYTVYHNTPEATMTVLLFAGTPCLRQIHSSDEVVMPPPCF